MTEEFSQSILIKVVAQICQEVGFEKIMTTSLGVLTDLLKGFILKLGRTSLQYGEHCGHSVISIGDISLAFQDCGIIPSELTEFLNLTSPLPKSVSVPKFPVAKMNPNTLSQENSDVDDLIEVENIGPDEGKDFIAREALRIKISFSKIKEACDAKKSKNKKKKHKRKKSKKWSD